MLGAREVGEQPSRRPRGCPTCGRPRVCARWRLRATTVFSGRARRLKPRPLLQRRGSRGCSAGRTADGAGAAACRRQARVRREHAGRRGVCVL